MCETVWADLEGTSKGQEQVTQTLLIPPPVVLPPSTHAFGLLGISLVYLMGKTKNKTPQAWFTGESAGYSGTTQEWTAVTL